MAAGTAGCLLVAAGCGDPSEVVSFGDRRDAGALDPLHEQVDPAALRPVTTDAVDAAAAGGPVATEWSAAGVVDARTLDLTAGEQRVRLRLAGISPPAPDHCLAPLALDSLRFMVGGARPLRLEADLGGAEPPSGRTGFVASLDGADVGEELLRLGLARLDPSALDQQRLDAYAEAVTAAQDDGIGIWADEPCDD